MSNFFEDVLTDLDNVQENILGPEYEYWRMVRSPEAIGMSGRGSLGALASNIAGLIGYVELLVAGGGRASAVNGPLGNRFFLKTGAQCRDTKTGEQVTRSLFVNNVPGGEIPFISGGMGVNFSVFRGLVPGALEGIGNVNPLAIFQAFMSGTNPECSAVTLPTVSANNVRGTETGFMTDPDIKNVTPCLFAGRRNPVSGETRSGCAGPSGGRVEQFQNKEDSPDTESDEYKSYIGECSGAISSLYLISLLILLCYLLSKAKSKK